MTSAEVFEERANDLHRQLLQLLYDAKQVHEGTFHRLATAQLAETVEKFEYVANNFRKQATR